MAIALLSWQLVSNFPPLCWLGIKTTSFCIFWHVKVVLNRFESVFLQIKL